MTTIKEIEWTETENTRYGPYEFRCRKTFRLSKDGKYVTETTYKNGIIWYDAQYPYDSEYARMRMA